MATSDVAFFLRALSRLCGWIYFLAWSLSFYTQPIMNLRRRSTVGAAIEFPLANTVGFLFYSLSTLLLYYSATVRAEYAARNPQAPEPTVRLNDVAFAVHAFLVCVVTLSMFSETLWGFQQSGQRISRNVLGLLIGCFVVVFWSIGMVLSGKGYSLNAWTWLDVVYVFGYCKLLITVVKYIPQAWANYRRKSTIGWSIGQILLDFLGGILSIAQLLIDSSLMGDWSGVTGNPVKFGLGNVSMIFDVVFMVQHYILYVSEKGQNAGERDGLLGHPDQHRRID